MCAARSAPPTLEVEHGLLDLNERLFVFDEAGRGSLSGPVVVGVVVIDRTVGDVPNRLRDSKLLSASVREGLIDEVRGWVLASGTGASEAREIDELGMMRALRLAAERAVQASGVVATTRDAALVDGPYDWISRPEPAPHSPGAVQVGYVMPLVKADMQCASAAGASVLAKVWRDEHMDDLASEYPGYGWEQNKGYGTQAHREAIREIGVTAQHRTSWNLI